MNRPLLILDLDETLIYATERRLPDGHDFECGEYMIYKRPHVGQFIRECSEHYNLAVWSSPSPDYAECVVSELFPNTSLLFVWSREKCTRRFDFELWEPYWVKDLKKVKKRGFDLRRVLIVDNTPRKLERNYGNVVSVRDFEGSRQDRELVYLADYLCRIAGETDFRAVDKRGWRTEK